jgi:hypothetical protein
MIAAKQSADLTLGDGVCVRGWGTANIVHEHGQVARVSQLYLTVKITWSNLHQGAATRRYRRDDGHSVPRHNHGGTTIGAACARRAR